MTTVEQLQFLQWEQQLRQPWQCTSSFAWASPSSWPSSSLASASTVAGAQSLSQSPTTAATTKQPSFDQHTHATAAATTVAAISAFKWRNWAATTTTGRDLFDQSKRWCAATFTHW